MTETKNNILLISEEGTNRNVLVDLLKGDEHVIAVAENSVTGLGQFRDKQFDVVILDLKITDSLDILKTINDEKSDIPVILISEKITISNITQAVKLGAWDYIINPITNFSMLKQSIARMLDCVSFIEQKIQYSCELEEEIAKRTVQIEDTVERLTKAQNSFVKVLSSVVELRDSYTAGHQARVAHLAKAIGEEMGLDKKQIESIFIAASIHDLGKLSVPAEILSKPNKLMDDEFNLIKRHPKTGYDLLKIVDFPWPLAEIVHQHHEKLDGSGYPQMLYDNQIVIEAKIICVADVVEAMASHRPYRAALGTEKAISFINEKKGKFFDKEVVDTCTKLFAKGYKILARGK